MSGFPPIEPFPVPPEPPRWPRTIGVLCIVYGAGGVILYGLCGLPGTLAQSWLLSLSGLKAPPMPPVMLWTTAIQAVVLAGLGILLIVGGVRLFQGRRSSRRLLAGWALIRLQMLLIAALIGVLTMRTQLDYQVAMNESVREMMRERNMPQADIDRAAPVVRPEDLEGRQRLVTLGMTLPLAAFPIFIGLLATNRKKREEFDAFPAA